MNWLERQWYQPRVHPLLWLLLPLHMLYKVVSQFNPLLFRLGLRKPYRSPWPVIVVGNLSVGGTGKTPTVLALVNWLKQQGYRPAIISRGYGGVGPFPQLVTNESAVSDVGDEPKLLANRSGVPVVVAPKRAQALHWLKSHYQADIDVIISDDGLQHHAMARDIELVVVDGVRGFGNGWCLPIGPLRETVKRLSKIDAVVYQGPQPKLDETIAQFDFRLNVETWRRVVDDKEIACPDGESAVAVAAIGRPQRFFDTLEEQGIHLQQTLVFSDHHHYVVEDFAEIPWQQPVIMTEKDATKCREIARPNWFYVGVSAQFPEIFWTFLATRLAQQIEQRRQHES